MAAEMAAPQTSHAEYTYVCYICVYMERIETLMSPPGVVVKLRLGVGKTTSP